jgi:hypothetical protein
VLDTVMTNWRSAILPALALTAVATLALSRLSDDTRSGRQNFYNSREDCERDYDASSCRSSGSGYYGPRYLGSTRTASDEGPGRTAQNGRSMTAASVHSVSRGGFGSTGRGYSGGYG